jgi:hypothetical protein
MADVYQGEGYRAVLTDHFLQRVRERVRVGFRIPYDKIFNAVRRYPERKCRALLNSRYWIVCKYEQHRNQVVFLTLMPKSFILPEPSIWVLI